MNRLSFAVPAFLLALLLIFPLTGRGEREQPPAEVTATGVVRKQGITTYMYGTHVLADDRGRTLYALRSGVVDLDRFVGHEVTVRGSLVPGYPVDFGPDYLEVKRVEER